jgi:hypothetical protein
LPAAADIAIAVAAAPVAVANDLQHGRLALAEALYREAQLSMLLLDSYDAPYSVPLLRPQMQKTFSIFPADRVLGCAEIEKGFTLFQHSSVWSNCQELLEFARK